MTVGKQFEKKNINNSQRFEQELHHQQQYQTNESFDKVYNENFDSH